MKPYYKKMFIRIAVLWLLFWAFMDFVRLYWFVSDLAASITATSVVVVLALDYRKMKQDYVTTFCLSSIFIYLLWKFTDALFVSETRIVYWFLKGYSEKENGSFLIDEMIYTNTQQIHITGYYIICEAVLIIAATVFLCWVSGCKLHTPKFITKIFGGSDGIG